MAKKTRKTPKKKGSRGRRKRRLLAVVRENAGAFLSSEEGKIVKKDIVKLAASMGLTAAILGATAQEAHAHWNSTAHTDATSPHNSSASQQLHNDGVDSGHYSSHSDVAPAHSSHSSHNNGGWC